MTTDQRKWVYLSDGGHFENLGIYELVRRRCRFIIACDAGQDGAVTFGDLGNAIEKCRADFGVDIEIDVSKIRPGPGRTTSEWHCAVGSIRYDRAEAGRRGRHVALHQELADRRRTRRRAALRGRAPRVSARDRRRTSSSTSRSSRAIARSGTTSRTRCSGRPSAGSPPETAAETMAGRPLAVQGVDDTGAFHAPDPGVGQTGARAGERGAAVFRRR